jgi:hypothetical protein
MKINSENCEAWFLDYYEGNLSKEREEELFAFLALNPELHELFDSYDEVSFSPDKQIHFDWKLELKKPVGTEEGINESNYEEYFVSLVEGVLDAGGKAEVEKFLAQFPAKREELELLQQAILLPDEGIVFEHKDSLRKSILVTAENFEELAISSVEGLLNSEEENAFAASVTKNAEQQKSYALYQQAKLHADASIVFEDKESLKRKDRGAFWWMLDTRFAAAAAIALLLGIFYWNYSGNTNEIIKTGTDVALIDSANTKQKTNPLIPANDKLVNTTDKNAVDKNNAIDKNDTADQVTVKIENGVPEKRQPEPEINPAPVKDRELLAEITRTPDNFSLATNVNPQVDFSDAYYSSASYSTATSPTASARTTISARQAAMRWMKNKLDRTPVKNAEEETYIAYAPPSKSENVSGFDLTSSAVSALGNATGANLRLGHETAGTVLTVGKYELVLSRN